MEIEVSTSPEMECQQTRAVSSELAGCFLMALNCGEWLTFQSFLLWLGNLPECPHFTIKSTSANSSRINYFCMTLVCSRCTKFGYFCYSFSCRNDSWRDPLRSEQGRWKSTDRNDATSDIVSLCCSISLPSFVLLLSSDQSFSWSLIFLVRALFIFFFRTIPLC